MQQRTRAEIQAIKAKVRRVLTDYPETRGDDDALYYQVCKERAAEINMDIHALHFSTVFLGNPLGFPKYESVVRFRRMIQRREPDLQPPEPIREDRRRKEADVVQQMREERGRVNSR